MADIVSRVVVPLPRKRSTAILRQNRTFLEEEIKRNFPPTFCLSPDAEVSCESLSHLIPGFAIGRNGQSDCRRCVGIRRLAHEAAVTLAQQPGNHRKVTRSAHEVDCCKRFFAVRSARFSNSALEDLD